MNILNILAEAVNFGEIDPTAAGAVGGVVAGGIMAFILGILVFVLIILAIIWVYFSLAFSAIAKKNGQSSPGLAWIPFVGPALVASKAAQMHWWPILLAIGFWIPYLGALLSLTFSVFFVIWMWKTFEAVGKPGWWAIFQVIPVLNIVWLVFIGIAAWSSSPVTTPIATKTAVK